MAVERCKLERTLNTELFVEGKYWGNEYYCVWVKDKTFAEIVNTDCHERCHHMKLYD
jgi:hypothetical protein